MTVNFDNWEGTVVLTSAAAVAVGDVRVEGDSVVVAMTSAAASGEEVTYRMEGRVNGLAAFADDVIEVGDVVYWDAGNSRLTTTASTHKRAGKSLAAKAATVETLDATLLGA